MYGSLEIPNTSPGTCIEENLRIEFYFRGENADIQVKNFNLPEEFILDSRKYVWKIPEKLIYNNMEF